MTKDPNAVGCWVVFVDLMKKMNNKILQQKPWRTRGVRAEQQPDLRWKDGIETVASPQEEIKLYYKRK